MRHASNEKRQVTHNGRSQTTKSSDQNAWRKETYKYLGILEAGNIKQLEMKEKDWKRVSQKSQKITRDKTL